MAKHTRNKDRQKFLALAPISEKNVPGNVKRESWINTMSLKDLYLTSDANKSYYRVLLERLWPSGHGIPGPYIKEDELREAVDDFRKSKHQGDKPYKPYVDVFRRLRELQGEEGVNGIGRKGKVYQLVSLTIGNKRIPRTKLSNSDWESF